MEIMVEEPMPTKEPTAAERFISGRVTASPDRANASTPFPIKARSTMLYSEEANIAAMDGMAYLINNLPIFSLPNSDVVFNSVIFKSYYMVQKYGIIQLLIFIQVKNKLLLRKQV